LLRFLGIYRQTLDQVDRVLRCGHLRTRNDLAIQLCHLVDLSVTDALYDKILLALAQLAPVTLIFLSGWYASWDTWYIPLDEPRTSFSEATFAEKADQWLQDTHSSGVTYYVFVDPLCPCTKPT